MLVQGELEHRGASLLGPLVFKQLFDHRIRTTFEGGHVDDASNCGIIQEVERSPQQLALEGPEESLAKARKGSFDLGARD